MGSLNFDCFARKLFRPCDPSSLGAVRIMFGLLMLIDIAEERGGGDLDVRWGELRDCHFPLFPQIGPLSLTNMSLLYGIMWLGALGITFGLKYRLSCLMFTVPYWYVLLLDKSYWNNHSYLYGLIGILLCGMSANHFWSLDAYFDQRNQNRHVPYWNYFIFKFQIFILYFYAGLKKTDMEWLQGYSMSNLGMHWLFDPFKLILSEDHIDYIVIHLFGFLLDLSAGFLLIWDKTRPLGIVLCTAFHVLNSRLFNIGMFPYVCLSTLPVFCKHDWPKKLLGFEKMFKDMKTYDGCLYEDKENTKLNLRQKIIAGLVVLHCCLQGFLPYSHFITKGYNNWTNGLYGYSWDMMIHSWDTVLVVVRVVDNRSGREHFLDPSAWSQNDRWNKHADMTMQYAECLKRNLLQELHEELSDRGPRNSQRSISEYITSDDISIFVDVWCSLNGRFQQRMYDPNYDLLQANWSMFALPQWLLPLLTQYSNYRATITDIQKQVYSWSNYSDVLFIADFPGLSLENYITEDLGNVSLTVLEGEVEYTSEIDNIQVKLQKGNRVSVPVGIFHAVKTISPTPSSYMYTYLNKTREATGEDDRPIEGLRTVSSPFPFVEDRGVFLDATRRMFSFIYNAILNVIFNVPMVRRVKVD